MRVLITGAAGFIGSHFLDCCYGEAGACIDKISYASSLENLKRINLLKIPFYNVDINETSTVIRAITDNNIDLIVNFAAETHVDNSIRDCKPFIESNVHGTLSILEACRLTKIRLLHISTDEVYGPASAVPFKEDDNFAPKNPYASTKAAGEHLIDSYRNTFGVKALVLRPTNNFGPRQNVEKFIPKYVNCIDTKNKFPLYGDGHQEREWFYVKDCAKMIRNLAYAWMDGEFDCERLNIGSPGTLARNIDVCRSIFNKKSMPSALMSSAEVKETFYRTIDFVADRLGHDKKYSIDVSKALSILPEFKFTKFEEALEETIIHYLGKSK